MVKQWQHGWQTEDTGQFAHSIRPVVSVKPWFEGQTEERSFATTISRVMSGHCSIRAHLERFRIFGDPICVCMMNYETVDLISFGNAVDLRSKDVNSCWDSRPCGNTNPGYLRASEVGSIEVIPQIH
jgi:hypothetical protein